MAPPLARAAWGRTVAGIKVRRARQAFERPGERGQYLPAALLPILMRDGFRPPDVVRYDPEGLVIRAEEKIAQLTARVSIASSSRVVELGCWDGMVLSALSPRVAAAYGVDRSRDGIDRRAVRAGVRFVQADAAALPFDRDSIDVVYSFAAFEHFADPGGVIGESARVLKPGGWLFLMFGPVYTSPYGLHAYRQIPIPYCHYLFTDAALRAYAARDGLAPTWPFVNGVTVTEYRRLWAEHGAAFESVYYREHPTGGVGAELIERYPDCFRGKVPAFDDLLVSAIEICLRKR